MRRAGQSTKSNSPEPYKQKTGEEPTPLRFLLCIRLVCPGNYTHTLNRNRMISPSWTTYSLPSERIRPFSRAAFSLPQATMSS